MVALIVGDMLLFLTTSFVFSITCLCALLHIRARDSNTRDLLIILVPLTLQMGMMSLVTYLNRVYPSTLPEHPLYRAFWLLTTILSVVFTSIMLLSMSRYLLRLLPIKPRERNAGRQIVGITNLAFLPLSLFFIFLMSKGDWSVAMSLALNTYFSVGSAFLVFHAVAALFVLRHARGREDESLLKGIVITFLPLIVLFPLDMLFLRDYSFRLGYLVFSGFAIELYLYISRHYVRHYEPDPDSLRDDAFFRRVELSEREREVARLLVQGRTNKEIGEALFISVNTVKSHIKSIYQKAGASNRVRLMHKIKEFTSETGRPPGAGEE